MPHLRPALAFSLRAPRTLAAAALLAGLCTPWVQAAPPENPPGRSASGTLNIANPEDKAALAERISAAIERAKEREAQPKSRRRPVQREVIPSVEVRVPPGPKQRKAARNKAKAAAAAAAAASASTAAVAEATPDASAAPVELSESRRYIQERADQLAAESASAAASAPAAAALATHALAPESKAPPAAPALATLSTALTCVQGQQQSPVHITTQDTVGGPAPALQFDAHPVTGLLLHTGHSIELHVQGMSTVGLRNARWRLLRVMFQHPAGEQLHGTAYPMATELLYEAPNGALAVVAVPMQRGANNPFLASIFKHMPLVAQDMVRLPPATVVLSDLLPTDLRYYQYMGSLTAPPCTEGILRIVLKRPVSVGAEQLKLLTRLVPPNARAPQPLHGRVVREAQ